MALYPNPHPDYCPWFDYADKWGAANIKWCERTLCSVISEPANTWSNLAYFVAFLFMLLAIRKSKSLDLLWLSFTMLAMGAFSFYYHMSNYYISQLLDFVGIYLFIFWYFCLNLKHLKILTPVSAVTTYFSINLFFVILTHISYFIQFRFQLLIVVAGAIVVLSESFLYIKKPRVPNSYKNLYIGLGITLIAQAFSFADLNRTFCMPDNHLVQGHAVWHIMGALGLYFVFKHQLLRYSAGVDSEPFLS